MDSIYWALALALTLFTLAWVLSAYRNERREIKRYQEAGVNYRRFVVEQKYALIDQIVERLKLQDVQLPPLTVASYSVLVDLYDEPELMPYGTPALAVDRYNIEWKRVDLDNVELFVLWIEGFIDHAPA